MRNKKKYEDSFWYDGHIKSNGEYSLYATGDIKIITPQGEVYRDGQAVEYAIEKNLTDKDLEKFEFLNNNWFEIIDRDNNSIDICDTYTEALSILKDLN
jgi:hypothetical protein